MLIAIMAAAIPAAALSGRLNSLFNFSNEGTTNVPEERELTNLRVADRLGLVPGSTVRLAERGGVAFYSVRGDEQRVCYGTRRRADAEFETLLCPGTNESTPFPSSSRPVLDLSPRLGQPGSNQAYFREVIGFAADGVAEVGIVDLDGQTHTTPVQDNVYYTEEFAAVPAQALVALTRRGTSYGVKP
jgi:hypothetical protein